MARISVSRRAASGIALIVGGALLVLAVLLVYVNAPQAWLTILAYAAIAVGLGILGIGGVNNTVAKITLVAAAVGWAILALAAIPAIAAVIPAVLLTLAAIVAGVGGLIAAIVLYVGREITNTAAVVFIVAMALGLLYLLGIIAVIPFGTLAPLIAILFGAALIVTGVYFRRTERSRR